MTEHFLVSLLLYWCLLTVQTELKEVVLLLWPLLKDYEFNLLIIHVSQASYLETLQCDFSLF